MSFLATNSKIETAVLLKRTAYELAAIHSNQATETYIEGKSAGAGKLMRAHKEHTTSLATLRSILSEMFPAGSFQEFFREDLQEPSTLRKFQEAQNIVTFGGDGTFLWAARAALPEQRIVAINSSPKTSVGFYSIGSVEDFHSFLKNGGFDAHEPEHLNVINYSICSGGKTLVEGKAINDLLVSGPFPASSARYVVAYDGVAKPQLSSGLWVCSPLGSNGAMRSAGGHVQNPDSQLLQWKVRELYQTNPHVTTFGDGGFLQVGEQLFVTSEMRKGLISVDGDTIMHSFEYGMVLRCNLDIGARRLFGRKQRKTI